MEFLIITTRNDGFDYPKGSTVREWGQKYVY